MIPADVYADTRGNYAKESAEGATAAAVAAVVQRMVLIRSRRPSEHHQARHLPFARGQAGVEEGGVGPAFPSRSREETPCIFSQLCA